MKGKCGDKTNQEWLQRVNIRIFRKIITNSDFLISTSLQPDGVIDIFQSSRTVRNIKGDNHGIKNIGIRIRV